MSNLNTRQLLVAFEGIDGAGKTTAIKELINICLREYPNLKIKVIRDKDHDLVKYNVFDEIIKHDSITNLYYWLLARRLNISKLINSDYNIIFYDRYFDSTWVYTDSMTNGINETIFCKESFPYPDITFYFDIDPNIAVTRLTNNEIDTKDPYATLAVDKLKYYKDKYDYLYNNIKQRQNSEDLHIINIDELSTPYAIAYKLFSVYLDSYIHLFNFTQE